MKEKVRDFLLKIRGIYRIPFLNNIRLRHNSLECRGFMMHCKIDCIGKHNVIIVEEGGVLKNCHLHVDGNYNKIYISRYCHANEMEIWIEDDNNSVTIGESAYFWGKIHLACTEGTSITIGKDCLFASDIVVRTGDSHPIYNMDGDRVNHAKSICIGDHVWMAYRVLIQKGAIIPDGCIIGTGAVVTKPFDEHNVILAGVPAKIQKSNVRWQSERK